MYNSKSENVKIKTLCAPGFSLLAMSYFRTYLTPNFVPWLSKDNTGKSQYCKKTFLSTTLNYEGAAYFYGVAMSILNGKEPEKQVPAVLQCKNDTTLTLEYKPDQNNQMTAYLVINKNNLTIPFRFETRQIQVMVDGQMVTKVIQAGLDAFAIVLDGYMKVAPVSVSTN